MTLPLALRVWRDYGIVVQKGWYLLVSPSLVPFFGSLFASTMVMFSGVVLTVEVFLLFFKQPRKYRNKVPFGKQTSVPVRKALC